MLRVRRRVRRTLFFGVGRLNDTHFSPVLWLWLWLSFTVVWLSFVVVLLVCWLFFLTCELCELRLPPVVYARSASVGYHIYLV